MNASPAAWQRLDIEAIALTDLARIRDFVRDSLHAQGAGDVADVAMLAIDEVCANLVMHAFGDGATGRVVIGVGVDEERVHLTVEDAGQPFPPESAPAPDLASDWSERRVGGLGWFFVRELMDECAYTAATTDAGLNCLTLAKRRGQSAPDASGHTTASGPPT